MGEFQLGMVYHFQAPTLDEAYEQLHQMVGEDYDAIQRWLNVEAEVPEGMEMDDIA